MKKQYQPSDLRAVTDEAWEAMFGAFVSSIPLAFALSWAFTAYLDQKYSGPMTPMDWAGIFLAVPIAAPYWWRWIKAIGACNEFTRQMRARRRA